MLTKIHLACNNVVLERWVEGWQCLDLGLSVKPCEDGPPPAILQVLIDGLNSVVRGNLLFHDITGQSNPTVLHESVVCAVGVTRISIYWQSCESVGNLHGDASIE